jgi:hypothetical protein
VTTEHAMSEHVSTQSARPAESPERTGDAEQATSRTTEWSESSTERADQPVREEQREPAGGAPTPDGDRDERGQDSSPGQPGVSPDGARAPRLVPEERARAYRERWNQLKGEFVDDPRYTVQRIDGLIGEVLDEIEQTFRRQRRELESGMGDEEATTDDLRLAFGRYREFFDRLLSV